MSDIEEFKRLLERRPDESVMDHAIRMFSNDPTGREAVQKAFNEQHEKEHHKWWICSFCKESVKVCDEDPSHTPTPLNHRWVPVPHPLGRTALVLRCSKDFS